MGKHEEILEGLRNHASKVGPQATMLAKVKSVDEAKFTCVLDDDGLEYLDVRLRPVLDGKQSITAFPKINTWALAVRIEDGEDWMVIALGEVDKVRMLQGDLVFEMEDYFLLKKGNETLKKIFDDLFEAIKLITVPTNVGPSGIPINFAQFDLLKTRIDNFLK